MFTDKHYVPILRGKMGEYKALATLDDRTKKKLTPLISIPPPSTDFKTLLPRKSIDEHLGSAANNIAKHWGTTRSFFIISW